MALVRINREREQMKARKRERFWQDGNPRRGLYKGRFQKLVEQEERERKEKPLRREF